ncbi:MAG: zinc ribbon domain-containing protein [Clostridia bacterium]|nr:zinc ribbon domain-containing protein [Clostridia bacterium]
MKYCPNCGKELAEENTFCPHCGNKAGDRGSSGTLGTIAFVLSIVGFMTGIFYIGIALDIVAIFLAIRAIKKSGGKPALPISGIVIAGVSLILMAYVLIYSATFTPGIVDKSDAPVATIVNNYGTTEQLTGQELKELYDGNAVAFNKDYTGAQISVVAKIDSIKGDGTIILESAYCDFEVLPGNNFHLASYLMPEEKIKVEGTIASMSNTLKIDDAVITPAE